MTVGDIAADSAQTAIAIEGAERHPLFPTVAGFASLGATFANGLDRAQAHADVTLAAQDRLGAPSSSVERSLSLLTMYQGDFGQAQAHAQTWVDLARASGDRADLAEALVMLTGAFLVEPDRAAAIAEEAIQVAREAGILSALSFPLSQLATHLPFEESDRAVALLDEAAEVCTLIGNRLARSMVSMERGLIALRRSEWRTALAEAVELTQQHLELGHLVSLYSGFDVPPSRCGASATPSRRRSSSARARRSAVP